jgi:prolyl oligopeptidase
MTKSGYAYVVKELRRGQTLEQAKEVFRGTADDVQASPIVLRDAQGRVQAQGFVRGVNFFEREYTMMVGGPAGEAQPAAQILARRHRRRPSARRAQPGLAVVQDRLGDQLRPCRVEARSQCGAALARLGAGRAPDLRRRRDHQGRADRHYARQCPRPRLGDELRNGRWSTKPIALPANSTSASPPRRRDQRGDVQRRRLPDALHALVLQWRQRQAGDAKTRPPRFNAANHVVEQFEEASRDGTKIPYFVVPSPQHAN